MRTQAVKQAFENTSLEGALEALGKSIARWTEQGDQPMTAIPGLSLSRRDAPTQPTSHMYEPIICLIAQGAKRVLLGDDTYVFDARHFLITSLDLPTVVQIIQASREKPYLSLRLKLDQREMSQLMVDSHLPPPRAQQSSRGMAIGEVTLPLLSAFQRLIDLLAAPQDMPILAPIIQREIMYRLLVGEQGARLRQMASAGSQSHQMLTEHQDAATTAFQVGYQSPSQFSREYSRLFGAPPLRDITSLRQLATSESA
jgi:AraC-like DNA-binding protein